jgi:hypothetical protein
MPSRGDAGCSDDRIGLSPPAGQITSVPTGRWFHSSRRRLTRGPSGGVAYAPRNRSQIGRGGVHQRPGRLNAGRPAHAREDERQPTNHSSCPLCLLVRRSRQQLAGRRMRAVVAALPTNRSQAAPQMAIRNLRRATLAGHLARPQAQGSQASPLIAAPLDPTATGLARNIRCEPATSRQVSPSARVGIASCLTHGSRSACRTPQDRSGTHVPSPAGSGSCACTLRPSPTPRCRPRSAAA